MRRPVRAVDSDLLDTFLVSAVATLLVIRIFLEATGYPQLGGGGLHIAHVLWGGLGMLVAIVLLLLFLSSSTRLVAAVVGGAGFGAFIDELGKFVTADNNYFFKPTAALVYVLFVVLFLSTREIRRFRGLSPSEKLVNAVELAEKLALHDLNDDDRRRALELLDGADQADPLVASLRESFLADDLRTRGLSRWNRIRASAARRYAAVAGNRWFKRLIAAIFILAGINFLIAVIATAAVLAGTLLGVAEARAALDEATAGSTLTSWIQLVAGLLGGVLVVSGVIALRRARLRAYRTFELAILVDLLLNLPFSFLQEGFITAVDVFLDLSLLATLRFLQAQERALSRDRVQVAPAA